MIQILFDLNTIINQYPAFHAYKEIVTMNEFDYNFQLDTLFILEFIEFILIVYFNQYIELNSN